MIDFDKIYTKEEFIELRNSEEGAMISCYSLDNNGEYHKYYFPVMCNAKATEGKVKKYPKRLTKLRLWREV